MSTPQDRSPPPNISLSPSSAANGTVTDQSAELLGAGLVRHLWRGVFFFRFRLKKQQHLRVETSGSEGGWGGGVGHTLQSDIINPQWINVVPFGKRHEIGIEVIGNSVQVTTIN